MEDLEFLKPGNKRTKNVVLIRKAFLHGLKTGVAFCHENNDLNYNQWVRIAWKAFVEKNKLKLK